MLLTESMVREEGLPAPRPAFGQGKKVMTVLADQGDYVKVITETPFTERSRPGRPETVAGPKGSRPMHRTTLTMITQPYTDYTTTSVSTIGAGRALSPSEVAHAYPSQHSSQFRLQHPGAPPHSSSNYTFDFTDKGAQPALKLHMPSLKNGLNMREGHQVKEAVTIAGDRPTYWTQYTRIHNKLGVLRGPGVPRPLPVRQQTNVLTGDKTGPAWKEQNRRVSGNRVLYHTFNRKLADIHFALG